MIINEKEKDEIFFRLGVMLGAIGGETPNVELAAAEIDRLKELFFKKEG